MKFAFVCKIRLFYYCSSAVHTTHWPSPLALADNHLLIQIWSFLTSKSRVQRQFVTSLDKGTNTFNKSLLVFIDWLTVLWTVCLCADVRVLFKFFLLLCLHQHPVCGWVVRIKNLRYDNSLHLFHSFYRVHMITLHMCVFSRQRSSLSADSLFVYDPSDLCVYKDA